MYDERVVVAIMASMLRFLVLFLLISQNTVSAAAKKNLDKTDLTESKVVKVRYGMTLGTILKKSHVPRQQIQPLMQAFSSVFNPRKIRAGEKLKFVFNTAGDVASLHYQPAIDKTIDISRDSLGKFNAHLARLPIIKKQNLLVGSVDKTLYEAVLEAGESPELIMAFSDIFQWDIDFFTDPRKGDAFGILYEKEFVIDRNAGIPTFLRYGKILAAAYSQRDTTLIAYSFTDRSGRVKYYDPAGKSFQKTFLKSPLNYRRISSYFSRSRFHPILKRRRAHTGVDFAARTGTPVVSAADGKVIFKGWNGGYGNCIKISHKNGTYVTLYGHLSRFAKSLFVGQKVAQNQLIGYVGKTGLATGPHLHYTMYYNGRAINPLKIRPLAGKPLSDRELVRFAKIKSEFKKKLGLDSKNTFQKILQPEEVCAR